VHPPLDSWTAFTRFIERYSTGEWIFRGVTNSSHKLIPKIGRAASRKDPRTGSPKPYSKKDEKRMLEEFKRAARPYFSQPLENDLETLAISQHHGMPTRLLDWTESALVAAYFACEAGGTGGQPPAIYAVKDLPVLKGDEDPFLINLVSIYRPPHISPRIPAQSAVFSVHPNPDQEEEYLMDRVEEWILEKGRPTFWLKQILDACAVNRASMFPDLDGLAQHLGWRYKWGRFS
jgi:hypothetical protein